MDSDNVKIRYSLLLMT